MTLQDKVKIYNKLLASLSKGVKLAALLEEKGETGRLNDVEQRNDRLAEEAAKLRRGIARTWQGETEKILDDIGDNNERLQDRIRDIERNLAIAERVVKALGYLDDLIEIARGVLV